VCKRWWRGLDIAVLLHAAVFTVFLLTSDSFRAAPATVNGWVFAVGILGGGIAAAIGGLISQVASGASSSRLEI
jgi:hypothetical protein